MSVIREIKLRQLPGLVGAYLQEITRGLNEVIRSVNTAVERPRTIIGAWGYLNMPASSTLPMALNPSASIYDKFVAHRSGSIRGITFGMSTPITAGTLRVQIYHNGSSVFEGQIDTAGTNDDQFYYKKIPKETIKFLVGDTLQMYIVTSSGYLPTTADSSGFLEVEFND